MNKILFFTILFISLTFSSDLPPYLNYLHPLPDSRYHRVTTPIILILKAGVEIGSDRLQNIISVQMDSQKDVSGEIKFASDGRTILFIADKPFTYDSKITVEISLTDTQNFTYHFYTRKNSVGYAEVESLLELERKSFFPAEDKQPANSKIRSINGVSVPSDFPKIDIFTNTQDVDKGRIFVGFRYDYFMILENDGTPYYYQKSNDFLMDFKVLFNGNLARTVDEPDKHFKVIMDQHFENVDTFSVSPGYSTDHHDMLMLENGNVLMIARDYQKVDMSGLVENGDPNATVMACHIQEFDPDKNLVWEWRSWDHIPITDAVKENLGASFIDFVHMNSIAIDTDGNLVASCRNLSACIKIERPSGKILWYLGGVNNSFTFIGDDDMNSYQHMFKPVPGKANYYTLFDNGNYHSPKYSRALEVKIDTALMTVEKAWEFRNNPDRQSRWLGGVQRLPNGNSLINWGIGGQPFATEVTQSGEIVYEAQTSTVHDSYRSYRFDWSGKALKPYLLTEVPGNMVSLIFNQFGCDNINYYNIYRGTDPVNLILINNTSLTRYDDVDLENNVDYYWAVSAVDSNGREGELSNIEHVYTNFLNPGSNLIKNGDFSDGMNFWIQNVAAHAQAGFNLLENQMLRIDITEGGDARDQIQLFQDGIPLYSGVTYNFEFSAGSTEMKVIEAYLMKGSFPWTNYSRIGPTVIDNQIKKYNFEFVMADQTDLNARVVFNWGLNTGSFFLDQVNLIQIPVTSLDETQKEVPEAFRLLSNYPNPFNGKTIICFYLPGKGSVRFDVFDISGKQIYHKDLLFDMSGYGTIPFNANRLPTGLYFYRLIFLGKVKTGKMVLIK